jgi:hypothetical protein
MRVLASRQQGHPSSSASGREKGKKKQRGAGLEKPRCRRLVKNRVSTRQAWAGEKDAQVSVTPPKRNLYALGEMSLRSFDR